MIVLDASALLELLNKESGSDVVRAALPKSIISIFNLAEVLSKIVERGGAAQSALTEVRNIGLPIEPFDEAQAIIAAELRRLTVSGGLSIGDRACLALANVKNAEVMTSDRAWAALSLPVTVTLIR